MASDSYKLDYDKVFGRSNRKLVLGIIVLAVIIYVVWQGYGNDQSEIASEYKKKILQETLAESSDVCSRFSVIEGEISCEDAVKLATEKYSGQVLDAKKAIFPKLISPPPNTKTMPIDVWGISIRLDKPLIRGNRTLYSIVAGIGIKSGEMISLKEA